MQKEPDLNNPSRPNSWMAQFSLHPDALLNRAKVLNQEGTLGSAVYASGRSALASLYSTFDKFADANKALIAEVPPGGRKQPGAPIPRGLPHFLLGREQPDHRALR